MAVVRLHYWSSLCNEDQASVNSWRNRSGPYIVCCERKWLQGCSNECITSDIMPWGRSHVFSSRPKDSRLGIKNLSACVSGSLSGMQPQRNALLIHHYITYIYIKLVLMVQSRLLLIGGGIYLDAFGCSGGGNEHYCVVVCTWGYINLSYLYSVQLNFLFRKRKNVHFYLSLWGNSSQHLTHP